MDKKSTNVEPKQEKQLRLPYQAPAIIYEGQITTRAGSAANDPATNREGVDPADLFGSD